jgi:hypothetical protein
MIGADFRTDSSYNIMARIVQCGLDGRFSPLRSELDDDKNYHAYSLAFSFMGGTIEAMLKGVVS